MVVQYHLELLATCFHIWSQDIVSVFPLYVGKLSKLSLCLAVDDLESVYGFPYEYESALFVRNVNFVNIWEERRPKS